MTLVAVFGAEITVTCRFDGSKSGVPASSGVDDSRSMNARELRHRVFGELRIGRMPLLARHDQLAVERAAPADLDLLAKLASGSTARRRRTHPCVSPRAAIQSSTFIVPLIEGPSSSPVIRNEIDAERMLRASPDTAASPPQSTRSRPSYRPRRGHRARRSSITAAERRMRPRASPAPAAPRRCVPRNREWDRSCRSARRGSRHPACPPPSWSADASQSPPAFSTPSSSLSAPPSSGVTRCAADQRLRKSNGIMGIERH